MNRSAFAACLAAVMGAALSARAADQTLTGYVYAALEEDGYVEVNTVGPNSQNYELNLPGNKPNQWAKLDGGLVVLHGTYEKDGTFTPDLKAPIVVQGTTGASKGKTVNQLYMQAPSRQGDGAFSIKFHKGEKLPSVGELIWAVGKFNGASYGMNVSRWNPPKKTTGSAAKGSSGSGSAGTTR